MDMTIDQYQASFLISVMGVSNIIGKIALGWISDINWINRLYLYSFCMCLCGLSE